MRQPLDQDKLDEIEAAIVGALAALRRARETDEPIAQLQILRSFLERAREHIDCIEPPPVRYH